MTIRVLLADDHPLIRSGIRTELVRRAEIEIVAEAENGDDALTLAIQKSPDILILDVNMPGLPVYQIIQQVKSKSPAPKVLIVSAYGDIGTVTAMLRAGVEGYVLKDEDPELIGHAVLALYNGENWFSQQVQNVIDGLRMETQDYTPIMTKRECELLNLLVDGLPNKEIALRLEITERTVEFHLDKIMDKLGSRTRTAVALWAKEHRFLMSSK